MKMIRLIYDTIIQYAVKLVAGNTTETATMESEEEHAAFVLKSKKISNDQELIQSAPTSCPQNQKGNN